jgi:hypothetical protein
MLKTCFLALLAAFIAVHLGACAVFSAQYPAQSFKRMKVKDYFADQTQIEFVTAIGRGDKERAQRLLESGAKVDAVGIHGMTALYWPILKRNLEGLQFLLKHGANPNTLTRWKNDKGVEWWASAIELAAKAEDDRYLRALLDAGADPNLVINNVDQTAIYAALQNDRYENASLLLKAGADINHRANASITPIGDAVYRRAYAAALFLLRAGADPTTKNRWGKSAVDTTREFGKAGTVIGSDDDAAYPEFVAELKRRDL